MEATPVAPPPEAQLIHARREAMTPRLSYRKAAKEAGISPERWRQAESGVARVAGGIDVPVRDVPAHTIARMARAVGVTPAELESAGRPDAAAELAALRPAEAAPDSYVAGLEARIAELEKVQDFTLGAIEFCSTFLLALSRHGRGVPIAVTLDELKAEAEADSRQRRSRP